MKDLRRLKPRSKNLVDHTKVFKKQKLQAFFFEETVFTSLLKSEELKKKIKGNKPITSTKSPLELNQEFNKIFPFTLDQFLIVRTILNAGSFKQAGEILFLSQPSISIQIKKLETQLNLKIFERNKKRLALTKIGIIFVCYMERILFLCEEISKILISLRRYNETLISSNQNNLKEKLKKESFLLTSNPPNKDYEKKSFLLKKFIEILIYKKDLNFKMYYFFNFSLFFLEDSQEKTQNSKSLKKKLSQTKLLVLTDEIFLGREISFSTKNKKIIHLIHQSSRKIEASTVHAVSFCLKTKLGSAFLVENPLISFSK